MKQIEKYYLEKAAQYRLFMFSGGVHSKIIDWVGTGKTILDVGCAAGYIGGELKKNGNKVFGLDISEKAVQDARKVLDDVIVGNIEDIILPYREKQFDVIICADVLEHLFQPEEVLAKLGKYLKDDGVIIVSLPNVAHWSVRLSLFWGRFEYEDAGLLDKGHIRFFTYDSALKMFGRAGYNIKKYDIVISLPKGLNKLASFLRFNALLELLSPGFFGYQFIFCLSKIAKKHNE